MFQFAAADSSRNVDLEKVPPQSVCTKLQAFVLFHTTDLNNVVQQVKFGSQWHNADYFSQFAK